MNNKLTAILTIGLFLLTGCNIGGTPIPTPTQFVPPELIFVSTETPSPVPLETATPIFTPTATPIPAVAPNFCADAQATALVDSLKRATLNNDGPLLSSLVSPNNGLEVRYFHSSDPIKYSAYQAKFLFETTYVAKWGPDPASGLEKKGAFHDVVAPELRNIFNQPYTLHCNEIRHGGASYPISWPYSKDFYSIYYAGTQPNGGNDWRTWVAGIEYVNGRPYLYALIQFFWEP